MKTQKPESVTSSPGQKHEIKNYEILQSEQNIRSTEDVVDATKKLEVRIPVNVPDLFYFDSSVRLSATRRSNLKGEVHIVKSGEIKNGQKIPKNQVTYTNDGEVSERRYFGENGKVKISGPDDDDDFFSSEGIIEKYSNGRVSQRLFSNNGSAELFYAADGYLNKAVFKSHRKIDQVRSYRYGSSGKVVEIVQQFVEDDGRSWRHVTQYNVQGDLSRSLVYHDSGEGISTKEGILTREVIFTYTYDKQGNWIQRVNSGSERFNRYEKIHSPTTNVSPLTYYRDISYYD